MHREQNQIAANPQRFPNPPPPPTENGTKSDCSQPPTVHKLPPPHPRKRNRHQIAANTQWLTNPHSPPEEETKSDCSQHPTVNKSPPPPHKNIQFSQHAMVNKSPPPPLPPPSCKGSVLHTTCSHQTPAHTCLVRTKNCNVRNTYELPSKYHRERFTQHKAPQSLATPPTPTDENNCIIPDRGRFGPRYAFQTWV
jgi:hypothetical protein